MQLTTKQPPLSSRLDNNFLGTEEGLRVLEDALIRSNDPLIRGKEKSRLIVDVDFTEDPAHGKQEQAAFNGHFGKNCFLPLFAFTSDGDCLGAKLRPDNGYSADGVLAFIDPIVKWYRSRFVLFWLRCDAAFADPEGICFAKVSKNAGPLSPDYGTGRRDSFAETTLFRKRLFILRFQNPPGASPMLRIHPGATATPLGRGR
jgi:hypothetical protein